MPVSSCDIVDTAPHSLPLTCHAMLLLRIRHVSTYDSIVKFDGKVKHHVINLIAKELTDFASEAAEDELVALRTGTSSGVPAASR